MLVYFYLLLVVSFKLNKSYKKKRYLVQIEILMLFLKFQSSEVLKVEKLNLSINFFFINYANF